MRGFGGVSKSEFYQLSYREIFESYFAEFDDDGELVPLRRRLRRLGETLAPCEMPSAETLDIPPDVLLCGVPMDYVLSWWSVWRQRGTLTTEQLTERWYEERRAAPPHNWRDRRA